MTTSYPKGTLKWLKGYRASANNTNTNTNTINNLLWQMSDCKLHKHKQVGTIKLLKENHNRNSQSSLFLLNLHAGRLTVIWSYKQLIPLIKTEEWKNSITTHYLKGSLAGYTMSKRREQNFYYHQFPTPATNCLKLLLFNHFVLSRLKTV